ncbi:cytochrome P450 [Achaetomium macrosporum]|uniref:Cytochrome P450 n=1 Tax=Achaetomium macrosporum TaxID=79813 RepID=A0AAN7C5P5_9PEZI|nr:cytochrome P450 [Achaetomium macrosporum]
MSSFDVLTGSLRGTGVEAYPAAFYGAAVLVVVLYGLYRWLLPKPIPGIPYNKDAAKSIWGDMMDLRDDPGGLAKWCGKQLEKHGTPICQALMGPLSKPVVLVADVPESRAMLMGRSDFDRSNYIIDRFPLFGEFHLNMKTGDAWRTSRGWLKDLLDKPHLINNMTPRIYSHVLTLLDVWERKSKLAKGRPFSMVDDLRDLALDVIMNFHFGDDFQDSALTRQLRNVQNLDVSHLRVGEHGEVHFPQAPLHEFQEGLIETGDKMAEIYTTKLPPALVSWWVRYVSPHYRPYFNAKDGFIRNYITLALKRLNNNEELKSGLDFMVSREQKGAAKAKKPSIIGKQTMVDEAYGNLIAGQHTTSAAMVWILKLLTDHPDVVLRLREELQTHLVSATQEGRLPTVEEILNTKLAYLEAVLEEVLRLRAAMLVPRDATRDTELLGHRIPKGTSIFLVCQGPDFSPSPTSAYWRETKALAARQFPGTHSKSPEFFDPERWLVRHGETGELEFDGTTFPQLGFGLGVRSCWGRRLAYLEMRIMTAMVVLKFDFGPVPEALATHDASYDISYRAKQGWVNFTPRA